MKGNNNFLAAMFSKISETINGAEKSFLDLLSAIVPYFVPVIPAYLTFFHTRDQMAFPVEVAFTAAFVVEVLGMTSISTAIRFWRNNRRYKDENRKAPFMLAIVTYVFYLVIVLSVNVLLEVEAAKRQPVIILGIALFSLLSVPSGVLISIRAEYSNMLEERANKNVPQGVPMYPAEVPQPQLRQKHASDYREKILEMLDSEYTKSGKVLAPKDITAKLKLEHSKNKGFVSTLTSEWKKSKGIS